jgi:hypothetical protein
MGITTGADQYIDLDALAADLTHQITQDTEAGYGLDGRLRLCREGGHRQRCQGEKVVRLNEVVCV